MRLSVALWLGLLIVGLATVARAESEPKEVGVVAEANQVQQVPAAVDDKDAADGKKELEPVGSKVSPTLLPIRVKIYRTSYIQTDHKPTTKAAHASGSQSATAAGEGEGLGVWHAFFASLSVIIVSELGDKTWFIAAIMAMRHSRLTVFMGAISALALMTVLSG